MTSPSSSLPFFLLRGPALGNGLISPGRTDRLDALTGFGVRDVDTTCSEVLGLDTTGSGVRDVDTTGSWVLGLDTTGSGVRDVDAIGPGVRDVDATGCSSGTLSAATLPGVSGAAGEWGTGRPTSSSLPSFKSLSVTYEQRKCLYTWNQIQCSLEWTPRGMPSLLSHQCHRSWSAVQDGLSRRRRRPC